MKRRLLVLVFSLLLLPTAAFAESWILWNRTVPVGRPSVWKIVDASDPFFSQASCQSEARAMVKILAKDLKAQKQTVSVSADGLSVQTKSTQESLPPIVIQFTCWPAGVNPH
jgi:hypothetical protein